MKKQLIAIAGVVALLSGCAGVHCDRCYSPKCGEKAYVLDDTTAYFALNSAKITAKDTSGLDKIVQRLNNNQAEKATLNGYTDSTGTEAYNLKLSERRAQSVKNYLTKGGVAADRITTKGYGETDFVATNETPEGRAKNRRVEIIIK